jgi:hypothetical protein
VPGNGRQPRWLAALAADAGVGLVGRVGFQQQLFQRHLAHQPLQPLRAIVGQWATEAEQEALPVQLRGLFRAAGKAVHHAAQAADAADGGDHRIHRASRVHDHRQLEFAGQFQLADEIRLLGVGVQSFDKEVQAAFADRAGAFALDPLAQQWQVPRLVIGQEHRMQAVGRVQPRRLLADLAQLRPAGRGHRRYHLLAHPAACARSITAARSRSNPLASRWQWLSPGCSTLFQRRRCCGVAALPVGQQQRAEAQHQLIDERIGSGMNKVSTNRPAVSLNRVG